MKRVYNFNDLVQMALVHNGSVPDSVLCEEHTKILNRDVYTTHASVDNRSIRLYGDIAIIDIVIDNYYDTNVVFIKNYEFIDRE